MRSKVVIRRLPPEFDQSSLFNEEGSLFRWKDEFSYQYFVPGKSEQFGKKDQRFSRLYLIFKDPNQILEFLRDFQNLEMFRDLANNLKPTVEFAPFQTDNNFVQATKPGLGIENNNLYKKYLESRVSSQKSIGEKEIQTENVGGSSITIKSFQNSDVLQVKREENISNTEIPNLNKSFVGNEESLSTVGSVKPEKPALLPQEQNTKKNYTVQITTKSLNIKSIESQNNGLKKNTQTTKKTIEKEPKQSTVTCSSSTSKQPTVVKPMKIAKRNETVEAVNKSSESIRNIPLEDNRNPSNSTTIEQIKSLSNLNPNSSSFNSVLTGVTSISTSTESKPNLLEQAIDLSKKTASVKKTKKKILKPKTENTSTVTNQKVLLNASVENSLPSNRYAPGKKNVSKSSIDVSTLGSVLAEVKEFVPMVQQESTLKSKAPNVPKVSQPAIATPTSSSVDPQPSALAKKPKSKIKITVKDFILEKS